MWLGWLQQLERTVQKRHVTVGRDDIGTIRVDGHAVFDLGDLHPGIPADELGENTLMIRRQMLYQDKSHPGVGICRHAREKRFECGQASGRRSNSHNRETFRRFLRTHRFLFHGLCSGGVPRRATNATRHTRAPSLFSTATACSSAGRIVPSRRCICRSHVCGAPVPNRCFRCI